MGSQVDDRNIIISADGISGLYSGHLSPERDIHDHDIRAEFSSLSDRLFPGVKNIQDLISKVFKTCPYLKAGNKLIFDNKYPDGCIHSCLPLLRM